jgi:hypothetical protein
MTKQAASEGEKEEIGASIFENNPDRSSYKKRKVCSSKGKTQTETKKAEIETYVDISKQSGG